MKRLFGIALVTLIGGAVLAVAASYGTDAYLTKTYPQPEWDRDMHPFGPLTEPSSPCVEEAQRSPMPEGLTAEERAALELLVCGSMYAPDLVYMGGVHGDTGWAVVKLLRSSAPKACCEWLLGNGSGAGKLYGLDGLAGLEDSAWHEWAARLELDNSMVTSRRGCCIMSTTVANCAGMTSPSFTLEHAAQTESQNASAGK